MRESVTFNCKPLDAAFRSLRKKGYIAVAPTFHAGLVLDNARLAALEALGVKDFADLSRLCEALGLSVAIVLEPARSES